MEGEGVWGGWEILVSRGWWVERSWRVYHCVRRAAMASILSSCSRSDCAVSGILVVGVGEGGRGWCLMGVLDAGVDPGVLPEGRNVLNKSSFRPAVDV